MCVCVSVCMCEGVRLCVCVCVCVCDDVNLYLCHMYVHVSVMQCVMRMCVGVKGCMMVFNSLIV